MNWRSAVSDRKRVSFILLGLFAVLIFGASLAFSQQSSKPVHVGVLMSGFEPFYVATDRGLVVAFRDRGYIEGKNLIIERRYGHLDGKRFSVLAHELAGMNLDAIVTVCTGTTRAAKGATNSTPIVMLSVPDPVGQGLAASLARPGTNVTGRASQHFDLVPKILQLFHEVVPKAGRIAVLVNSPNPLHQEAWAEALATAQSLNVDLIRIEMQGAEGLDAALDSVPKSKPNALFVLPDDPTTFNLRRRIIAFARERALPLLASYREVVEDGALMSYGESFEEVTRGVALYVDKVVRGTNPAELPIAQPTRFELTVNRKAANELGITIPSSVLVRADRVIE
jgi:putative tryptophan/tyrosine transport system substrate-binding protein